MIKKINSFRYVYFAIIFIFCVILYNVMINWGKKTILSCLDHDRIKTSIIKMISSHPDHVFTNHLGSAVVLMILKGPPPLQNQMGRLRQDWLEGVKR